MKIHHFVAVLALAFCIQRSIHVHAEEGGHATPVTYLSGWQMQDAGKVSAGGDVVSTVAFKPSNWYAATVPGTVLTTLVNNNVYPEPLYGENMRPIPESINKTKYWYRTTFNVPSSYTGRHTWIHFGGINYSSEVWVNGRRVGTSLGAFIRSDFDISPEVEPGSTAALAVLVAPQPHPGTPHEHTVSLGEGPNGGDTAIDGPTFLSTIGWDWLPAIRDRDTGIWLPVSLYSTGPVTLERPFIVSDLSATHESADLTISVKAVSHSSQVIEGTLKGIISGQGEKVSFEKAITVPATGSTDVSLDARSIPELHIVAPKLWWPNGYGSQSLYHLELSFQAGTAISDTQSLNFGIRKVQYEVPDSENLTLSVNGVRIMARGGNWGLDEGMKRVTRDRLDAQFHMHALANLNIIRNWVGQSSNPDFYDMADKYGILLWDEFFQPNPSDGPDVNDTPTYLANVEDKVVQYRNHPSIVVWCARNEGYPPKDLDDSLKSLMAKLDPTRLYQSNSADGRGVSSHGPYYWRSPRFFYALNESFKTETGSVSIPTIESIQGMMPQKDWETINDDWAQHDMAAGAQRGNEYPLVLARRYGPIRNLADFVRKGQLANYEAFRAMYEGRNAEMFKRTTGIITWMSNPAQPSFVWQLYHYDLEPNAALFAVKKASEPVHVQLNEANRGIEVVNNKPYALSNLTLAVSIYRFDGTLDSTTSYPIATAPASSTVKATQIDISTRITQVYFIKLDLTNAKGNLLATNFYWQNIAQDDFTTLSALPVAVLEASAVSRTEGENTFITLTLKNNGTAVALMTHVQLHDKASGKRVLPVFYSDNYISLVAGQSTQIIIEAATKDISGQALILLDGYNVDIKDLNGTVPISLNQNAQPSHWPASSLVPNN